MKKPFEISILALLKSPCPKCQQVWATVKGTSRKRQSVRCFTRGHLLRGHQAATHETYKQLVFRFKHPNPTTLYGGDSDVKRP